MIKLKTNIDKYNLDHFPDLNYFNHLPRVGDQIQVLDKYIRHYISKKLPIYLTVTSVIFTNRYIQVELHFGELQLKSMKLSGINPYS